ncbi:MAG TPA: YbjN domain-containing protein, partial [Phototrophicaceae bacterium]|nr:YbjN domain-containing protein [Phototrophicaceae bacterium]
MPIRLRQDQTSATLQGFVESIEKILSMIDVNAGEARAHSLDGFRWLFPWGSVTVEVNVVQRGPQGFFQVSSPLVFVPDQNLEAFYRSLLDHNMEMTSAALGVHDNIVYVFSERPLMGMDTEEAR